MEKAENPLFRFSDANEFATDQLAGLVPYPSYYHYMGPINQNGPTEMAGHRITDLTADALAQHIREGASVLDGRERHAYASGHVPGSIGIEIGSLFAPWAGWLLDFDAPIALVLEPDQDADDAATELSRIGLEDVVGVMRGITPWSESGREVATYPTASWDELEGARRRNSRIQLLDVRDPLEWEEGHLRASVHAYVPTQLDRPPSKISTDALVWVICRTGNRASIAAGILERSDLDVTVITNGGVPDLIT